MLYEAGHVWVCRVPLRKGLYSVGVLYPQSKQCRNPLTERPILRRLTYVEGNFRNTGSYCSQCCPGKMKHGPFGHWFSCRCLFVFLYLRPNLCCDLCLKTLCRSGVSYIFNVGNIILLAIASLRARGFCVFLGLSKFCGCVAVGISLRVVPHRKLHSCLHPNGRNPAWRYCRGHDSTQLANLNLGRIQRWGNRTLDRIAFELKLLNLSVVACERGSHNFPQRSL